MAVKASLLFAAASLVLLPSCSSVNTGRYVKSEAFENCRNLQGDARDRCLKREEESVALQLHEDNQKCLDEIEKERERTAMRRGEQAGRPGSTASTGC